jgi:DNA-binding MarR family transcriptional regulator
VSDISESPEQHTSPTGDEPSARNPAAEPTTSVQSVAPAYRPSSSLEALEELVNLAAQSPQAVARRGGLSVSELHSLRHLSSTPMGPVELAKVLGVTSAASSGVVDRLVARGHAERRAHTDDRRRTEVVVTESGRREIFALLAPMFTALAETDNALSDEERVVVERYLRGAIAALRSVM